MAAAVLAYGIVYFSVELYMYYSPPWPISYLFHYLAGLVPSYLVCRRTGSGELGVGVKSSAASWGFTTVSLTVFTEGSTMTFLALMLIMFLLGGLTAAYLALRRRLKPRGAEPSKAQDNSLNQPAP